MSHFDVSDSTDIWHYIPQLPRHPSACNHYRRELFRSRKFQASALRFGNSTITGAQAERRVAIEVTDNLGWACTKEATDGTPIDLFAVSIKPPYKIALIQVKSAYEGSRTVHVNAKHIEYDRGPVWIILVETNPSKYDYLVFSHSEFKKFVTGNARYYGIEQGYENPEWDFSVPKNLEDTRFEKYQNKWWKIEKNSRLYR